MKSKAGFLALLLRPETCAEKGNPSFLGHRQQHIYGSTGIAIDFLPEAANEKAGLLVFQNEQHFYFLCKSMENDEWVVQLYRSTNHKGTNNPMELIVSQKIHKDHGQKEWYLKIEAHGNAYSFLYALKHAEWKLLQDNVDATFLSTRVAGGFVGCMYALYATSMGLPGKNVAYFDWFKYQGEDQGYR